MQEGYLAKVRKGIKEAVCILKLLSLMHDLFFAFLSGWIAALSALQVLAMTPFLQASWADLLSHGPYGKLHREYH